MAVDLTPTEGMASAAKRGLRLHEEGKSGDGLKPETVARAGRLSRREEMNEDWVREMNAWFARHEADRRPGWDDPGEETPGFVAWLLWGGDAGQSFAARKVAELDREDDRSETVNDTNIERRDWEFADDGGLTVETRADGAPVLTGFAVKYGTLSVDLGGFREQILPGAFDKILSRSYKRADVVALYNHNADLGVLGRTSSGTLELESNDKGLLYRVVLPNTELGRMVQESVARRDLRGSSFAFTVDQAGESWGPGDDGKPVRSIREASGLFDVSVVTHPAYPSSTTSVARRSLEAWLRSQQEAVEPTAKTEPDMRSAANAVMRLHAARLRSFLRGHKR